MTRALGRYELLRPLGRGGMAEVFLARRRAAGIEKLLVVKRIRPERANDVEFLDLFVREARLSMSLTHQNIVPVFDFGRIDDQVYFAMERIEGKDLGSSLARTGDEKRMPPVVAAFIAAECCQALEYAHHKKRDGEKLGIVHRDVTPRNVLISWAGEVKLTDFGIAALAGDENSKLLGTPAYMAPEQATKAPIDVRTDVYATGMLLREALTNTRARSGTDRESLIAQAKSGELSPWPSDVDVPPALVAIVDRATALKPEDRYPNARAMFGDLDAYIVSERAAHTGDPPARRLAAWLASVWEGAREDTGSHMALDAHVVSLFDDLDAVGTGTQRSLLATAADETPPPPPPVAQLRAKQERAESERPAPAPNERPDERPSERPRPPRPIRWLAAGIVGALALSLAVAIAAWPVGNVPRDDQARIGPVDPPKPTRPLPAIDPSRTGSAGIAGSGSGSGSGSAHVEAPRTGSGSSDVRVDHPRTGSGAVVRTGSGSAKQTPVGSGSAPKATPAATLVDVPVNSIPWANFTVDSDPTVYTTLAHVMLSPGPHTIHFTNPTLKLERTVAIEVPPDNPAFKVAIVMQ